MAKPKSVLTRLLLVLVLPGCANASGVQPTATTTLPPATTSSTPTTTTAPATTTTTVPATTTLPPATTSSTPTTTSAPRPNTTRKAAEPRTVTDQPWTPFATAGTVILHHPSSRVERIGFHESSHDGARPLEVLAGAVAPETLETRERGTGLRTAADVVVQPGVQIRAPVTGTVIRGGSYVLYCDHRDHFLVIEPDARPGWEVKVLHIAELLVGRGTRVEAGVTPIAPGPTQLPFESQVDETTKAEPAWPHVHIEVIDPSIKDRPGKGC